jgi:hypothetical protein
MTRARALIAATALGFAALSAPAAVAGTGWGPEHVVTGVPSISSATAAVDAAGDAALALHTADQEQNTTLLTTRPAGGVFGAPVDAAPDRAHRADLPVAPVRPTVAPDGTAYAAAQDGDTDGDDGTGAVLLRAFPPGGAASAPVVVAPAERHLMSWPLVAVDRDGTTVVAWQVTADDDDYHPVVHWAIRPAGGAFGPVQSTTRWATDPQLATDAAGDMVLAWREDWTSDAADAPFDTRVRAIRRPAGGAFGPVQTLSTPLPRDVSVPSLAIADGGRVALAWVEYPKANPIGEPDADLRVSVGTVAGGFGPVVDLASVKASQTFSYAPAIAVNAAGQAVATWTLTTYGPPSPQNPPAVQQAARRSADGVWEAPTTFPPRSYQDSLAALGPDGTAILVWNGYDHTNVSVAPPGAPFPAPMALASGEIGASLAMDGDGDALLAWADDDVVHWMDYDGDPAPASAPPVEPEPAPAVPVVLAAPAAPAAPAQPPAPAPVLRAASRAPAATPKPKPRCAVPKIINLTPARARARLLAAHCRLGTVTTPKRLARHHGLVVRRQSRTAGHRTTAGAKVAVTLGVKPREG